MKDAVDPIEFVLGIVQHLALEWITRAIGVKLFKIAFLTLKLCAVIERFLLIGGGHGFRGRCEAVRCNHVSDIGRRLNLG